MNMKLGLRALRTVPTKQAIRDIISMIRRPYISENFPKIIVTRAITSEGMDTDQA